MTSNILLSSKGNTMRLRCFYDSRAGFWKEIRFGVNQFHWYDLGICSIDFYPEEQEIWLYVWRLAICFGNHCMEVTGN